MYIVSGSSTVAQMYKVFSLLSSLDSLQFLQNCHQLSRHITILGTRSTKQNDLYKFECTATFLWVAEPENIEWNEQCCQCIKTFSQHNNRLVFNNQVEHIGCVWWSHNSHVGCSWSICHIFSCCSGLERHTWEHTLNYRFQGFLQPCFQWDTWQH